jgi:purine-binding chemotaxis protein CheW
LATPDAPPTQHLVFACADTWYAVDAQAVQEVVVYESLTHVPGAPAHMLGVFPLRGEVFPVVDLNLLRGRPAEPGRRVVTLRLPQGGLALTAGHMGGVGQVEGELVAEGEQAPERFFLGPGQAEGHPVWGVDLEGLFAFLARAT